MSSKRNVVLSGAIAAIVAIALIGAAVYIPGSGLLNRSTSQSQTNASSSGTMSVLFTDPPTVPQGVTALYMTYSDVQVHVSNAGNNSGWTDLSTSGEINLMSVVNVSETIANANISTGVFNALRFNITSVVVTYNGVNYTADLVYGHNALFVPIPGGISVSAAQTSAAMIDLTPKVLLLGTPQNPTFAFLPSAKAFIIPSQSIPAEAHHVGERHDISHDSWWMIAMRQSRFAVTSVQLSPTSLNITVSNTGNASIVFRLAAVTSQVSVSGGWAPAMTTSSAFVVQSNGSLIALSGSNKSQVYQDIAAGGYLLAPHTSATFTYSGQIQIGSLRMESSQSTQQIVVGQNYVVTLLGNDMTARAGVTAS